jgi:indolepyruvate ferredoxin oxidoreductase, beta subunit
MKNDIILAGVGGQGIVSIASVIGYAAVKSGHYLKQSEVHGMSQRGGDVQSHLRISAKEIFSDLIPLGSADLILSIEPMEALRYLPYLSPQGWVVTNTRPFKNITHYPNEQDLQQEIAALPQSVALDADALASEIGATKSANMVMLGAAAPFLSLAYEKLQEGIQFIFERKGEKIVQANLDALAAGRKIAESQRRSG